jgi:hypothetical protein
MKLSDTINLMVSDNYKERFQAEYFQTKIRYEKLHKMLIKLEAETLDFKPDTPHYVLEQQAQYMGYYLKQLEIRAEHEGINLEFE